MKIAMIIIRTLMGALLVFASVSWLFKLFPVPEMTGGVKIYNDGLAAVNLMLFIKIVELVCGLAFLIGRFVALAAVLVFPIVLNIVLFHAVLERAAIGAGIFLLIGDLFLAFYYRQKYAPLFTAI